MPASDTSRPEKETDWDEGRRLYEIEGWTLREVGAAIGVSHESVRRHIIAGGWERDDEAVVARDAKRRQMAQQMVTGNIARWAERRAAEADEAGTTAQIARERALVALMEGDAQMARVAAGVYLVMVEKAQLLTGAPTGRVVAGSDDVDRFRALRDELGDRRTLRAS